MIDWARIDELRREIGDDGLKEVAEVFLEEVEETLAALAALPDGIDRSVKLHFLKGSALNLGFTDLAELCRKAELGQAGQAGIDEISVAFSAARHELKAALSAAA